MIFTLKTEVSLLTDVFSKVFQTCVFSHCGLGPVFLYITKFCVKFCVLLKLGRSSR